jgi:hypothetical protein
VADEILDLTPADSPGRAPDLGGRRWAGLTLSTRGKWVGIGLVFIGMIVGLIGLVAAYGDSVRRARVRTGWPIAVVGGGCFVVGVVISGRRRFQEIAAFEHGMIYRDGGRTYTVYWAEVTAVTEVRIDTIMVHNEYDRPDQQVGRTHTLRIQTKDGGDHRFDLGVVDDSEQFAGQVHSGTLPHLVPRAAKKIDAGHPVPFGPFLLTADGLSYGRHALSWAEMSGVSLDNGTVIVTRRGDRSAWAQVACAEVPNVNVLLNLIRGLSQTAAGGRPDPDRPGASRYSVLDRYTQPTRGPRIGY